MRKLVSTDKAPKAIGPYSQAVIAGEFLYVSGQLPINPQTGLIEADTIETQTIQVMENIKAILSEVNMNVDHIVKTTCFLSDMVNFAEFNKVYGQYITSFPARSCVAVREIPKGVLVEVDVIAHKQ